MNKLLKITIVFTFALSVYSCTKDKGPFTPSKVDTSEIDTVSFTTHVQPIFDASCISCHNASHSKLDLQPAVSYNQLLTGGFSAPYVDTANPTQSNIYLHLTGALSIMPPSGSLPDGNIDVVLLWIEQGALNN